MIRLKQFITTYSGILTTLTISCALFFFLFSELFDPTYVDWLYDAKWDPFQYYISWALFRFSEWQIPLLNTMAGFPIGISVVYTDTIPLLAFVFKIFSGVLPNQFQYFGLWMFTSFCLQGVFSYLLIKQFTGNPAVGRDPVQRRDKPIAVIGSIFFVLSPIMLLRLPGQFAHGSHWLILAALYLYLHPKKELFFFRWLTLLCGSLLIHGYTFIMILGLFAVFCADRLFIRKFKFSKVFGSATIIGLVLLLLMYVSGFFFVESTNTPGFGLYSMNLLSLINPSGFHTQDWSFFLPSLPQPRLQYEGFHYLGIGMMFLLLSGVLFQFSRARKNIQVSLRNTWNTYWPLLLLCLFLFFLAITHQVYLLDTLLFSIPLPERIVNMLGTIRGSGRMFWPVYYLIFLLGFRMIVRMPHRKQFAIVLIAVSLQIIDLSPKLAELNHKYENKVYVSPLTDPLWDDLSEHYRHISFIPRAESLSYEPIAIYAETYGMSVNDMLLARPIKGNYQHIRDQIAELEAGAYAPQTLYVFSIDPASMLEKFENNPNHFVGEINGYPLFAPNFYQ